jgi:hypothetical protein
MQEKLLSVKEVIVEFPFLNSGTLANYRNKKQGAKFYKVGRKVLYNRQDIERWLTGNPVLTIDSLPE